MLLIASWLSVALKSEVRIWTRVRNDDVDIGGLIVDSFVHGGDGDDITGAAGNDLLIRGHGRDRIIGSTGHDILVAGEVGNDISRDKLLAASYLHVAVEDGELIGQLFQ
jgi:Ca2+-binding RTX toxin-like protein